MKLKERRNTITEEKEINSLISRAVNKANRSMEHVNTTDKELQEALWNRFYHREMNTLTKERGLRV